MALKRKIDKAGFESLSESFRGLYKPRGEDFVLDLDTSDDEDAVERLRRAKDAAAEEARTAKEEAAKARKEAQERADEVARKTGDVASLEKSWQEKLSAREKELMGEIKAYKTTLRNQLLDSTATALATDLFGKNAKLAMPHVQQRLGVDFGEDGSPVLRVLGPDGKPSAASLQDLRNELLKSEDFSGIIRATDASGGSSARRAVGLPNTTTAPTKAENLGDMDPAQLVALIKAKKESSNGTL